MIKFRGTRKEFGEFHGEYLKTVRHNFWTHIDQNLLKKQLKIYERYYPELVVECTAAAKTANIEPERVLFEDLASFVLLQQQRTRRRTHGCTIFALSENGKTFVGRNYDWLSAARNFFEQYDLDLSGAYRYFAFSDESVWYRHIGKNNRKMYAEDTVNEHGLYIGLTYSHIDQWNYGLAPTHFLRLVAEKCKTTRQALNIFAKVPCAVPKNFLIADAKGNIAVVEHAATDYDIVRPEEIILKTPEKLQVSSVRGKTRSLESQQATHLGKLLVHTNNCLSPKLQPIDHVKQHNPTANTYLRYEEAKHLVEMQLPGFQFTDIWRILRKSHYVYNNETIWSLALELSEQRFNIYCDTTEGQKEKKFSFDK